MCLEERDRVGFRERMWGPNVVVQVQKRDELASNHLSRAQKLPFAQRRKHQ